MLAYAAGVLRGVVRGTTSLTAATATVAAYRPGQLDQAEGGELP